MLHAIIIDPEPTDSRLLVLEDQFSDQIRLLGRFACEAEALSFLERIRVDLIFWDLRPEGMKLLKILRNSAVTAPVILVTADPQPGLLSQSMALGIMDCVLKPADPVRLRHSIQNFLDKLRLLRCGVALTQNELDHLFHNPMLSECGDRMLPKGLSQPTLAALEQLLRGDPEKSHTCESLSEDSGLSRVTVRNYLNVLLHSGKLSCTIDYETGGRPRVVYHAI